ncbi:DsbC family protein [Simiduia aestuariiviva]|uniref:Thiol:disulfide interchange protein n=1 Tax=Simiduia aestuariiviva TaxID=1510459 RepID=A0A839UKT0_9GAMM|nr:DsbC family protein [Simiduia aestuariiviva]MBB3168243.1 thiol:disulfide interchange protein DsbC [Simiduia aestuariiviva]
MTNLFSPALALTLALVASFAFGQAATGVTKITPEIEARLKAKVAAAIPHMAVTGIENGPFAGIYAVRLNNGPVLYTDASGEYLVAGDLYKIEGQKLVNVEELARQELRAPMLAAQNVSDMIVFPAKGKARTAIYVFTDVDCGYCRKLHREVPQLNAAGVEVRYLAYPRAGLRSESYNKLARAWCSDNPTETLTRLKNGQSISGEVCAINPIAGQFNLGGELGVRGTPAIFLTSGELISGYRPAPDLLKMLGLES